MKTETFLWIVMGLLTLTAILGLIFILLDKKINGKRLLKISGYSILFIFIFIINVPKIQSYNLHQAQIFWEKHGLPQIDSSMCLELLTNDLILYSSWCEDSVLHSRKWIEYDIFDIYSVEDIFINKEKSKILTYYFIKQNILRDSSLIVTINNDTISKMEGDLVLKDWGIYSKAYSNCFEK